MAFDQLQKHDTHKNCDISKRQKTAMTFFSQAIIICYKWQLLCCAMLFDLAKPHHQLVYKVILILPFSICV